MKQRIALVLFALLSTIFVWSGSLAFASEAIPGEYLVKYRDNAFVSMASIRSIGSTRVMDHNPYGQIIKVKVSPAEEMRTVARLMSDPNVEYVVPNIRLRAFTAPFEISNLREQWAMKKVNAEKAWQHLGSKGSRNVIVAVIDTGVDYNHESLKPNMIPGYDFRDNDADPYDKTSSRNPGHGTHCAGVIGATGLISNGIVGLSPEVSMMPIRFLGEDGSGDLNGGIKSIDFAIQNGAKIISASWGATVGRAQAAPLIEAVKRADDAGVIFIAAAANDGRNNDSTDVFPANANFPNMITVAASGPNDEKPNWSNFGKRMVHVAAPGLNIMSTLPQNKYANLSGTSMATPLVSGLVALLASKQPNITGAQARALLQHTGAKVQIETACNCRVDAFAAVEKLMSGSMYITPAAATLEIGETLKFEATNGRAPFTYSVANASIGTVTNDGVFSASGEGETTVTVRDANGSMSNSLGVRVIKKGSGGGGGGNPPPGGGGDCPLGDQALCDILCQIQPTLPFCK
jgi:thermitase